MRPVGELVRDWRQRRRMSQLDLASGIGISTKHLSFVETGRSTPSRDMVLRLAEFMEVPLRDQNGMLAAAGFAPIYRQRSLNDPALSVARRGLDIILAAQEPNPTLAIDRHWTVLAANRAFDYLIAGVDGLLLRPPVNLLRLTLHPAGLAPRVTNLAQWRRHVVQRLRQQVDATGDRKLNEFLEEIQDYPPPPGPPSRQPRLDYDGVAIPFQVVSIDGTMSFLCTTTVFDAPMDITLAELSIETFLPADAETADQLRRKAGGLPHFSQTVRPVVYG
jgi:transcriptional regulator with XRE-family HTH domain